MPMCCGQLRSDSVADIDAARTADLAPLDTAFWSRQQEELSSQGLRVLALCRYVWQHRRVAKPTCYLVRHASILGMERLT
jgi:hypothetical protein